MASQITETLRKDTFQAVKDGDEMKAGIARIASSAIKNQEIEKGSELTNDEEIEVLKKEAKKLKDSIEQFGAAGREDLVAPSQAQLDYLNRFLPAMMSDEEIAKVVDDVIAKSGAEGMKDMGKVMGQAMGLLKDKADGGQVKKIVEERLA